MPIMNHEFPHAPAFNDDFVYVFSTLGQGPIGKTGDKGDKGDKGEKGERGEKGDSGTANYKDLENKPSINSVKLDGNLSLEDIGIKIISNNEIDNIISG